MTIDEDLIRGKQLEKENMMLRHLSLVLAGGLLVGCSTSAKLDNPFEGDSGVEARRAAFAASSDYPKDMRASDELKATALINRDDHLIQIINASDRALTDAKVWVNSGYVAHVSSIPANGSVTLDPSQFYDHAGHTLSEQTTSVTQVQVETANSLYNLQGPVVVSR